MAKQNISKKKNTKPILVPLSLDLLLEEGILPTDWPHTDKAFDASGEWTHSFSTHGSHGYKGDKSSLNGSMRISRRLTGKTQQLMVTQNVAHTDRTHQLKATLHCAVDPTATPLDWQLESSFTADNNRPVSGIGSIAKGSGKSYPSKRLASDWSLIDAIQRLPFGIKNPLHFDLLEGLTLLRPNHELSYRSTEKFGTLTMHRFDQTGTGILPYNYWLDENHRLVLFITHTRAYWLDSTGDRS